MAKRASIPTTPSARRLAALAVLGALAAVNTPVCAAQPDEHSVAQPQAAPPVAMDSILKRLDTLEAAAAADKPKDEQPGKASDEKWSHTWGGRIYADWVNWPNQNPSAAVVGGQNYFEFRRLRIFVEGEGYGVFKYKFELDWEPENAFEVMGPDGVPLRIVAGGVEIKDMYLGVREIPWLGTVLLGHFKAPFSLEQLTSSKYITFMERSPITRGDDGQMDFTPGREVGAAAYNHSASRNATWAYGAFFDGISPIEKQREDMNQGATVAARATWTPYYDEPSEGRRLVHAGLGFRYTHDQDGRVLFAARPEIHEGVLVTRFFSTGVLDCDDYYVGDLELASVWGPFSVQCELMRNHLSDVSADLYGFYVLGSLFLTGENRAYDRDIGAFARVTPFENFRPVPGSCGLGAWEAKVRWACISATEIGRGQLNDLTAGFNWYWNPHTRLMFDWIHAWGDETARGDLEADIVAMRLQWDF